MKKNLIFSGIIALVVSLATVGIFSIISRDAKTVKIEHITGTPSKSTLYTLDENNEIIPLDFTGTAEKVIDGVVHIKSTQISAKSGNQPFQQREYSNPFRDFFGDEFEQFFGPFQFRTGQRPNGPRQELAVARE